MLNNPSVHQRGQKIGTCSFCFGPELFGELYLFHFFSFDFLFCPFSLLFAEFGAGNGHFNSIQNILEFESIIFHGVCNMLVLELLMPHGLLQLGFV